MANDRKTKLTSSTRAKEPTKRWLCVIEFNDISGPRRSAFQPQLKVCKTVGRPSNELEGRLSRKGVYTKGDFVAVRYDLMPHANDLGGLDRPAVLPTERKALDEAYTALRDGLEAAGCMVNRREAAVYRLYVCGLDEGCIKRPKGSTSQSRGDLYVGQTSKSVQERLEEHLAGSSTAGSARFRSNKYVRNHFQGLRQDLIPSSFPELFFSKERALRAESLLRIWLEQDGYTVEGAQERYDAIKRDVARSSRETVLAALIPRPVHAFGSLPGG